MIKVFYRGKLNKHLKGEMKSNQHSKEITLICEEVGEYREVWVTKLWWRTPFFSEGLC